VYTGHFAVALAGASVARRVPLWLLILAAFASDLAEGVVAALSIRDPTRVWSHSLPIATALGAALAVVWLFARGTWREAGVIALVGMSHTALDYVTGLKSVWPGTPPQGLYLYQRPWADAAIEVTLCVIGWWIWRRSLTAERRTSFAAHAALAVLLLAQAAATARLLGAFGRIDLDAASKFVR
jgi:hypothetical protein